MELLLDMGVTPKIVLQFKDVPQSVIESNMLKAYNEERVMNKAAYVVVLLRRWQAAQQGCAVDAPHK